MIVEDPQREPGHVATTLRVLIVPDTPTATSAISAHAVREIARSWRLIGSIVVLTGLLAFGATFLVQPRYDAEVSFVHIRNDDQLGGMERILGQLEGLGALVGIDGTAGGTARNEDMAILTSRRFLESFIERRKLLPLLFSEDWDIDKNRWRRNDPDRFPTMQDAIVEMREKVIELTDDRVTSIVSLRVRWHDADVAAEWANDLLARANEYIRDSKKAEAESSIQFLHEMLKSTDSVETRNAIFRLVEAQMKVVMLTNARADYAFRIIDPAVVSDADGYVSPNRALISVVAMLLALMASLAFVGWRVVSKSSR